MIHRTILTRLLFGASTLAMLGCLTAACAFG